MYLSHFCLYYGNDTDEGTATNQKCGRKLVDAITLNRRNKRCVGLDQDIFIKYRVMELCGKEFLHRI